MWLYDLTSVLTLAVSRILIFLDVEAWYDSVPIQAQSLLLCIDFLRKCSCRLDVAVMLKELKDLLL